ncbi:iron chelate uptake ABC transporter family permease subunit [Camelliibacillus cellulosilyticus]|uniref:Iron chelate uptake ABC transporter family permease subunit n=1 Tax=Camelliibacillus cellulosilyticus TaxID=2174486 RepID=A0ABV9GQK6_9BACL
MKVKIIGLAALATAVMAIFLFIDSGGDWGYVLPRRGIKIITMIVTGGAIAFSTVIFQTITNNRILTPSIIGLDSLYMLIQTFVVFAFGAKTLTMMSKSTHFMLSVGLMIVFSLVLYQFILKREGRNIYLLLLAGIIFGTLFSSLSSFMEMVIDPDEFLVVQHAMFASFNNMDTDLLSVAIGCLIIVLASSYPLLKVLDVLSLGKDQAKNLGVDYDSIVKRLLIVVAILVSIATALVGPITFLGLLVVNITYQFLNTYRHRFLITGAVFISIIALIGGQLIVERLFTFSTTITVIINFIGGIYFLYLLLKENKSW